MPYTPLTVNPLTVWLQNVLPLVYDDSLSYLEFLGKVSAKLNELITANAAQDQALIAFLDTFEGDLTDTVTTYLDAWKLDGTLQAILTASLEDFNVALDAHKLEVIALVDEVDTRVTGVENVANGKMTKTVLNVKDFGAVGNGIVDDTVAIQTAIGSINATIKTVYFPAGSYLLSASLLLPTGAILKGEGAEISVLKAAPIFTGSDMVLLVNDAVQFCEILDLGFLGIATFFGSVLSSTHSVGGINFVNAFTGEEKRHRLKNLSLRYISGTAVRVTGRGGTIIENIDIYRAILHGLHLNLWDSRISKVSAGQCFNGKGIWVDNACGSLSFSDSTSWGNPINWYIDGAECNFHGIISQESKEYGIQLATAAKRTRISGNIDGNGYNHVNADSSALYVNSDQNIIDLTITNRLMYVYGGDCMIYGLAIYGKYNQINVTIDGATTQLHPSTDTSSNRIRLLTSSKTTSIEPYGRYWNKYAVTSGANLLQTAYVNLRPRSAQFMIKVQDVTDKSLFAVYIVTYLEGVANTLYLVANKTLTLTSTNTYGTVTFGGGSGTYDVSAIEV